MFARDAYSALMHTVPGGAGKGFGATRVLARYISRFVSALIQFDAIEMRYNRSIL